MFDWFVWFTRHIAPYAAWTAFRRLKFRRRFQVVREAQRIVKADRQLSGPYKANMIIYCALLYGGSALQLSSNFAPVFGVKSPAFLAILFMVVGWCMMISSLVFMRRMSKILGLPLASLLDSTCHACGYDLRGNADPTICPECGAKQFVPAAEATET